MEALQTWLNDKKNLPYVIGGFVVILLMVGFIGWRMFGPQPAPPEAEVPGTVVPPAPGATAPGMPGPGGAPVPGADVAVGVPPVATPDGSAPPADQQASAAPAEHKPPLEGYRSDPFKVNLGPKPPKPKPVFVAKRISPPDIRRVSPVIVEEAERETLPPQPLRRMAGLLKNGNVMAVIESADSPQSQPTVSVVRAGQVLEGGVMVDRILPDKVILKSTETRQPIFIEVPKSPARIGTPTEVVAGPGPRPQGPRLSGPRGPGPMPLPDAPPGPYQP